MTGPKPKGVSSEAWIDKVVAEARARGEFDDLAGAGKPIADLGQPHDELWWVRRKLADEGVSYLPPTLALRKDREETLALVDGARTEAKVRQLVEELNARIIHVNRTSTDGPPSTVMPLDIEEIVASWRQRSEAAAAVLAACTASEAAGAEDLTVAAPAHGKWWRRGARRPSA